MDPQNQNPTPLQNNAPVNPAPSFTPPPQYAAPVAPAAAGGSSLLIGGSLIAAIIVVGGGYYWLSSSREAGPRENSQFVPTGQSQDNRQSSAAVAGGASCGNWPAVDPHSMAPALVAPGSSVPAAFYSGLPIPPQSKYLGASKRDPQPIVLTAADADKGAKGVGMFFFCSDMGAQQVFDYLKANGGTWTVKNPTSYSGTYGLTFQQITTGAQDYFADVVILDAGGKTLVSFVLTTFF